MRIEEEEEVFFTLDLLLLSWSTPSLTFESHHQKGNNVFVRVESMSGLSSRQTRSNNIKKSWWYQREREREKRNEKFLQKRAGKNVEETTILSIRLNISWFSWIPVDSLFWNLTHNFLFHLSCLVIYKRKEHNIPGIKTSHEEKEEGEATKNKTKRKKCLKGTEKDNDTCNCWNRRKREGNHWQEWEWMNECLTRLCQSIDGKKEKISLLLSLS